MNPGEALGSGGAFLVGPEPVNVFLDNLPNGDRPVPPVYCLGQPHLMDLFCHTLRLAEVQRRALVHFFEVGINRYWSTKTPIYFN